MARYIRRHRRKDARVPGISLTPLIDTALTLLIIFMVTTPMMQNSIKVELPQGEAKEDGDTKQELVVYVDKDEQLFFNGKPIMADKLIETIKRTITTHTQKTVFVKADKSVHYGNVIQLVDQIKVVGGIKYVVLATQRYA